jgi:hypothetical protein
MATTTKTKTRAEVVKDLLGMVEAKMAAGEVKATLGDYIRLLQMEKEMGLEEPDEIRAGWVEPEELTGP